MNDQPFFALSSYHVGMALNGAGITRLKAPEGG
jgi:hypothetical protein